MSHYTLDELIDQWRREKLTAEQMIGQILQVLKEQERRMRELGRGIAPAETGERAAERGCKEPGRRPEL
jgi:hypothetical protein